MKVLRGVSGLLLWVLIGVLAGLLISLLGGCCWLAKRDCFPPCPEPPTTVVTVERPCKLPPEIKLAGVKRTSEGCPEKMVCFAITEAGQLAKNLAELKDWIREVRGRCGPKPSSQPTSRPAPP
jgi:hypothetical protein